MSSKKLEKYETNKLIDFKKLFLTFKYSLEGIFYSYKNEKALIVHLISFILVSLISLILNIGFLKYLMVFITSALILGVELINTAIEAVVDMYTSKFNEKAKIAKDCASGATFVVSWIHAIICIVFFAEAIWKLWR